MVARMPRDGKKKGTRQNGDRVCCAERYAVLYFFFFPSSLLSIHLHLVSLFTFFFSLTSPRSLSIPNYYHSSVSICKFFFTFFFSSFLPWHSSGTRLGTQLRSLSSFLFYLILTLFFFFVLKVVFLSRLFFLKLSRL